MTLERRVQALVDLVEADQVARCAQIAGDAAARSQAALRDAWRKAREDVSEAFAEERRRAADVLAGARARLATQRRHAEQRQAAALLDVGLARLPAALDRRWQDPPARAGWVGAIAERCLAVLPARAWEIAHPVDWPPADAQALGARIAEAIGVPPVFVADPRIAAGLRVAAGGIVIDGTTAGLVGDRQGTGARLLGLLELARRTGAARG